MKQGCSNNGRRGRDGAGKEWDWHPLHVKSPPTSQPRLRLYEQTARATGVSDRQPPTFPTPLLHTRHSSRVIITRPVLPFQGLQSATPTAKRTAFCLIGSFLRKSTKFRDLPVFLNIPRCIFCFFECIFNLFIYMPPVAIRTVRAGFRRAAEPRKIKKPHCSFGSDHAVAYAN